jgi:Arc/MetJ-type ribon-helix-helix transcriptional regulator
MATAKVAVTIDQQLLEDVDRWVAAGDYPNRSQAVQAALRRLREERQGRSRLLRELGKLDPSEEQALADEALAADEAWLEY